MNYNFNLIGSILRDMNQDDKLVVTLTNGKTEIVKSDAIYDSQNILRREAAKIPFSDILSHVIQSGSRTDGIDELENRVIMNRYLTSNETVNDLGLTIDQKDSLNALSNGLRTAYAIKIEEASQRNRN